MPTNKRIAHRVQFVVDGIALLHLMEGDCLIGGGCGLCDQEGDDRILRVSFAREVWAQQREALLAEWRRRCEDRNEPGSCEIPTFAQVLFDGAALPPPNEAWPEVLQRRRFAIAANLAVLARHR